MRCKGARNWKLVPRYGRVVVFRQADRCTKLVMPNIAIGCVRQTSRDAAIYDLPFEHESLVIDIRRDGADGEDEKCDIARRGR